MKRTRPDVGTPCEWRRRAASGSTRSTARWSGGAHRPCAGPHRALPSESASPARSCAGDSTRQRAAASSMASGMPSSWQQMPTTSADVLVGSGSRVGLGRAIDEQADGVAVRDGLEVAAASGGSPRGGTRQVISPGTFRGSRLVARIATSEQRRRISAAATAHPSARCSQLSSTSSTRCRGQAPGDPAEAVAAALGERAARLMADGDQRRVLDARRGRPTTRRRGRPRRARRPPAGPGGSCPPRPDP